MTRPVYTIGHSNRTFEQFLALLQEHGITRLVDVRTLPGSRHNPQFDQERIGPALAGHGIQYTWLKGLGGLRGRARGTPSRNDAWRNASFRNYADYMGSPAFDTALQELLTLATADVVCIMCSEAVPWRCHRSLVGDALLVRGRDVIDVIGPQQARPHRLTPFAVVEAGRLIYPAQMEIPDNGGETTIP